MKKTLFLKVTKEEEGMRLDLFLLKSVSQRNLGISRVGIKRLILDGKVLVNNAVTKPSHKVKYSEMFKVILEEKKPAQDLELLKAPLDIIYQDEDVAVVNKPSGLVVHPGAGNPNNTLVNVLPCHFKNLSQIDPRRPGIVHRLDKDTSGLMVIAKNDRAHLILAKQFAKHTIERRYVALVKGFMEFDEDVIELPISRHPQNHKKMAVGFGDNAKYAKTFYRVLTRQDYASLVQLTPFTGRTHQLRVHLAFIGHPILGDKKYGKNNEFSRLALTATEIGFAHPVTNKFMKFSQPVPEEFLNYIKNK
jgi:23S rRNA pseudouridine1911/1915/1917 synthase